MRILLIEDDLNFCETLRFQLEQDFLFVIFITAHYDASIHNQFYIFWRGQ